MSPQNFELLTTDKRCNTVLPLNPIDDEFVIVRFAPLFIQADGSTKPVVVPRDVMNPELMRNVRDTVSRLPYEVGLPVLRGGMSLNPEWNEWSSPPQSDSIRFDVPDRNKFLSDPTIMLGGKAYKPNLTPGNIRELMTQGTTIVAIDKDKEKVLVEIKAALPTEGGNLRTQIDDLYKFLSNPKVSIGSYGTYELSLTEKNVEELSTLGVSEVQVGASDKRFHVYLSTGRPSLDTNYTRSALRRSDLTVEELLEVTRPGVSVREATHQLELKVVSFLPAAFQFVLYLPYRQTWELLGYCKGELLNTISLGPQEETTIEIFTWDRLKRTREDTLTTEQEGTLEVTFTDKDSLEIVKEITKESGWQIDPKGQVNIPGTADVRIDSLFRVGESLKDLTKKTHLTLSESVRKASARIKTTRQTKITESEEFGREEKVTRKVKNPNMCRTLNLDYFEILAGYKVTNQLLLDQVKLCILTDEFLPKKIDRYFILCYEGILRDALLSKVYEKGFDAVRTLATWEKLCAIKCLQPCPCEKPTEQKPSASPTVVPSGTTGNAVETTKNMLDAKVLFLAQRIGALENATSNQICGLANDIVRWGRYALPGWVPGAMDSTERKNYEEEWQQANVSYHKWLYRKTAMELLSLRFWNACLEFNRANDVSPEAVERLVAAADPNILADVFNVASISIRIHGKAIGMITELLSNMCFNLKPLIDNIGFDDAGLGVAFGQVRDALNAYKDAIAAQNKTSVDGKQGVDAKKEEIEKVLEKAVPDFTPKAIAEAQVDLEALLCHIESNESYYRQAIWRQLDANDRLVALSTLGNIARFVDEEVLGFVGKKAALPFRTADYPEVNAWLKANVLDDNSLGSISEPINVTVPTKGVMMEARLGQCDACEEFITKHRELDLQQKTAEVKAAEERVRQETLETERYRKRLDKDPAELGDPDPNDRTGSIRLIIKQETT